MEIGMPEVVGPRPKIVDVARAAGVSPTTVSHALNGRGQVDPRTRERVLEVARELGYRPHAGAQRLRTGRSRNIALISSMPFTVAGGSSRLGFFMEIASAAAETALTRGLALVLVPPLETLPALEDLDIGGAVVVEPRQDDAVTQRLRAMGVPVVSIGAQPGDKEIPFVDMHHRHVSRLMLEHLVESGSRHVALLVGSQKRASYLAARQEYRAFARRHAMPQRVVVVDEMEGEAGAHHRVVELLATSPEVDGICAVVDTFATGAVAAVHEAGRSIPGDVRVVTRYDGLRARTSDPPLSAVDLHLQSVATAAVELLLHQLSGEAPVDRVEPAKPVLVPRASSQKA
jgi:DNA-binding LacI/PurR family transcriptional regulator